jgi:hypothetical protein
MMGSGEHRLHQFGRVLQPVRQNCLQDAVGSGRVMSLWTVCSCQLQRWLCLSKAQLGRTGHMYERQIRFILMSPRLRCFMYQRLRCSCISDFVAHVSATSLLMYQRLRRSCISDLVAHVLAWVCVGVCGCLCDGIVSHML